MRCDRFPTGPAAAGCGPCTTPGIPCGTPSAASRCWCWSRGALGQLWPPPVRQRSSRMALPPEEKMARLHRLDGGCRWSLLPFMRRGHGGRAAAGCPQRLCKGRRALHIRRVLLALTPGGPSATAAGIRPCGAERKERRHGESAAAASAVARAHSRPDKVMYIGGSDTLPPPLPARRRRRRCIARLERGRACWRGRRSSSGTCGWWSTSPAGLKTPASTSRI